MTKLQNGTSQNLYSYNGAGTISAIQHNGFQYDFNYDVFGKLISTKIGNTALSSNTYSASGLLTRTTYANGDYIDYSYDDYDRVVQMEDENDVFARFVYNKKGLVTKYIDDLSGITTYYYYDFSGSKTGEYRQTEGGDLSYYLSYDSSGNTVEKTAVGNAVRTITSGTDSDGNAFVSNDGVTVTSEKDDFGRISSVTTANANNSVVLTSEYTYMNGAENHSTTNIMNGIHQTLGNTDLAFYHYGYDANNNITGIYEQNTLDLSYTYDSLNQLTSETNYKNSTATQYEYDSNGNITRKKNYVISGNSSYLVSTDTYVYVPDAVANANSHFNSAWNDQLFSYNGTEIIYDDLGNPLHYRDGMEFEWTRGRLLDTVTVNNTEIQMYYDSNGLRTQKGDIYYYYDSESKLIALKKNALTMFFYYDSAGNPIAFSYNGCMHYYVKNLQGDIVRVVNEAGNTVASYEYDAWGKLLAAKNYYGVPVTDPNSIVLVNPLRYRGYVYDDETGLYYLQSRYYDPTTCRFLNADVYCDTQSRSPLSTNMFAYCENNPIYRADCNGGWYEDEDDFREYQNNLLRRINTKTQKAKSRADWTAINQLRSKYNIGLNNLKNCKSNYRTNSSLFRLYQLAYSQNDFIYNQTLPIFEKFRFGNYSVSWSGCGAIALYNVMRMVAGRANLANIIFEMELNSMLYNNGLFGTDPNTIPKFLSGHCIKYYISYSLNNYKILAMNHSISILYVRTGYFNLQKHYYCIVKILGKYYSLNQYNNTYTSVSINLNHITGFIKAFVIL